MKTSCRVINAIFQGKSFIDAAIAVRKMKDLTDFLPEVMRGSKLTGLDLKKAALVPNKDDIAEMLARISDRDDDPLYGALPDQVSNALHYELARISLADFTKGFRNEFLSGWAYADAETMHDVYRQGVTLPVSVLNRQITFLWHAFKQNSPSIDVLTKDAFDLVESTKLDANVTADMVEQAFPKDLFISMQKPFKGLLEVAMLRRGMNVYVVSGKFDKSAERFTSSTPVQYLVLGRVDMTKQIGGMTRKSVSESIIDGARESNEFMRSRLAEVSSKEEADRYMDKYETNFVSKEQQSKESEWIAEIVMFVMKLRLMMTAEKAPIEMVSSVVGQSVSHAGVQLPPGKEDGLSFSVISLTRDFEEARRQSRSTGEKLDKFGKKIVEKQIGGFLRRQHYGPGNSLSKYIYIAPFTNRFWVNTGIHITKIVK